MTTNSASIAPIIKQVTVGCTPEEAFRYFTADIYLWWPVEKYSIVSYATGFKDRPESAVIEPRVGGRIFERARSGEEHMWGRVLEWQPPVRLVFSFGPGRDEKEAQTVEVTFSGVKDGTKVVLTHSDWEKLGPEAQRTRDEYNGGWETVFVSAYPDYVQQKAPGKSLPAS